LLERQASHLATKATRTEMLEAGQAVRLGNCSSARFSLARIHLA